MENESGLGRETTFDFKYIPNFSKSTQMENETERRSDQSGIERRNFQTLVIGCGVLGFMIYFCLKFTIVIAKSFSKH